MSAAALGSPPSAWVPELTRLVLVGSVIAYPHFKQVAQHEYGVGRGVVQIAHPGIESGRLTALQMQVRNEIDHAPVGRSGQLRAPGRGRGHGAWVA